MKVKISYLIAYKLFFAFLGFSAIVTEIAVITERGVFNAVNFFSFFTIQTNMLVVATLLLSAIATAAGMNKRWLDILRAATTVYILVVGIGFAVLLSGLQDVMLTAVPWDNTVLHYIIPVAVLLDFIIDRPKKALRFMPSLLMIIYPLLYVTYSLVRGAMVGWYPYPFLNPATKGYGGVAITVLGLVVLGVALILIITWLTRRTNNHNG